MRLIILCVLAALASAKVRYDGYKLVSVTPDDEVDLKILRLIKENFDEIDFWTEPNMVGRPVDFVLSPKLAEQMDQIFGGMDLTILDENIQSGFDRNDRRKKSVPGFHLNEYNSYADIMRWLNDIVDSQWCPYQCSLETIGTTYEGRDIQVFRMYRIGPNRDTHWIDATMHAREWMSTATIVNFINRLVFEQEDPEPAELNEDYNWYFLVVANPDGYIFSHDEDPMWRKNRNTDVTENPLDCVGVDLNRNFDVDWNVEGTGPGPCYQNYAGPAPNSEPETHAYYTKALELANVVTTWTSVHAYGNMWMFPWGVTVNNTGSECIRTDHFETQLATSAVIVDAIEATHDTTWTFGTTCDTVYPTSGTSVDYVYKMGIVYSFTPELRGPGFQPDPINIPLSSTEFWNGIVAMVRATRT